MFGKHIVMAAVLCMLAAGAGCVRRTLCIRSQPEGAPVWVDETYVGDTPVDVAFTHYGSRRIRVGPVMDEAGMTLYRSTEGIYPVRPPWYQRFPLDFFFEVLWPERIEDVRQFNFRLDPAETEELADDDGLIRDLLDEAGEYRDRSALPP